MGGVTVLVDRLSREQVGKACVEVADGVLQDLRAIQSYVDGQEVLGYPVVDVEDVAKDWQIVRCHTRLRPTDCQGRSRRQDSLRLTGGRWDVPECNVGDQRELRVPNIVP